MKNILKENMTTMTAARIAREIETAIHSQMQSKILPQIMKEATEVLKNEVSEQLKTIDRTPFQYPKSKQSVIVAVPALQRYSELMSEVNHLMNPGSPLNKELTSKTSAIITNKLRRIKALGEMLGINL